MGSKPNGAPTRCRPLDRVRLRLEEQRGTVRDAMATIAVIQPAGHHDEEGHADRLIEGDPVGRVGGCRLPAR
jgi:hypothetical protein